MMLSRTLLFASSISKLEAMGIGSERKVDLFTKNALIPTPLYVVEGKTARVPPFKKWNRVETIGDVVQLQPVYRWYGFVIAMQIVYRK